MRVLVSTKKIPVWYLKAGLDNHAYDKDIMLWLPGRTTPVRKADRRFLKKII